VAPPRYRPPGADTNRDGRLRHVPGTDARDCVSQARPSSVGCGGCAIAANTALEDCGRQEKVMPPSVAAVPTVPVGVMIQPGARPRVEAAIRNAARASSVSMQPTWPNPRRAASTVQKDYQVQPSIARRDVRDVACEHLVRRWCI
jgi:hypothetical protein